MWAVVALCVGGDAHVCSDFLSGVCVAVIVLGSSSDAGFKPVWMARACLDIYGTERKGWL